MLLELLALVASDKAADARNMFCGEQTAFIIAPGEKLKSVAPGIHVGSAVIQTPRGELVISDGNHWAEPASIDSEVLLHSGVRIAKAASRGSRDRISYAVFGRLDGSDWGEGISKEERVVAWITGPALRGDERDDSILERFRVVPFDTARCKFHLDYGWDVILGDDNE